MAPAHSEMKCACRLQGVMSQEEQGPVTDGAQHDGLGSQVHSSPAMVTSVDRRHGRQCPPVIYGDMKAFSGGVCACRALTTPSAPAPSALTALLGRPSPARPSADAIPRSLVCMRRDPGFSCSCEDQLTMVAAQRLCLRFVRGSSACSDPEIILFRCAKTAAQNS